MALPDSFPNLLLKFFEPSITGNFLLSGVFGGKAGFEVHDGGKFNEEGFTYPDAAIYPLAIENKLV